MIGTCGSSRNASYRQCLLSQPLPDQSVLLYNPPKQNSGKGSCQDPIPLEFQDNVTLTLSCLGGHLQIHGDTEPSPVVLGEQATMEKTTQRFQKIATTLADLNAEGLHVQTVNDLLTMYVGAASQHVLRMSFVPEQEAQNFDRQVLTFWSRLMHRDITSQLFFSTPQAWWFWSGFCCSTTCGCPMACVAVDHPFIDVYYPISGHRFTFSFNTTATCPTHSTPIHHLPTNEQTLLPTQTTRSSSTPPNHPTETSLHHPKEHP